MVYIENIYIIWIYWGSNPYRIESTSGWIWWFFSIATSTRNEEIYWEYVLIILFDFSWIGALRRKSKEAFAGWYQCWRLVHSEDCCHLTPGWRLLVVPLVRAYLWNPGSLRMLQILPGWAQACPTCFLFRSGGSATSRWRRLKTNPFPDEPKCWLLAKINCKGADGDDEGP